MSIVQLAKDLTGLEEVLSLIRYGDDSDEINEVVAIGEKGGERKIESFKLASSQLTMLRPFTKVDVTATRDQLTKLLFTNYLEYSSELRFFQAVRNFAKLYFGEEYHFIGHSSDGKLYTDTFYLECDDILEYPDLDKEEIQ